MSNPELKVQPLMAPVVEATLSEDRAQVIRRGRLALPAGLSRLEVAAVAPVLVDKSLCATIRGPQGAAVVDARVTRRQLFLEQDLPTQLARLEREATELRTLVATLSGQVDEQKRQEQELAATAGVFCQALNDDAAHGLGTPAAWQATHANYLAAEAAALTARVTHEQRLAEVQEQLAALERRLAALRSPASQYAATLVLDVQAGTAGEYEVQVAYLVPNACWRPWHRAVLRPGEKPQVELIGGACAWQHTGEDWADAQLWFSTQRSAAAVEPPELAEDRLQAVPRRPSTVVTERDQAIHDTGLGTAPATGQPEVPGIDDNGQTVLLRAAARATVPSDGRPVRVELFTFSSPTELTRVLLPELTTAVILKTTQANAGTAPLLAGPVDLLRDGGFCGRTTVLYVASAERFALGWGPDPALRASRREQVLKEESKLLSAWTTQRHEVTITLSNLGPEPRTVQVTERVPVSEIEKVEILLDAKATTDGVKPDADGLVRWTVEMAAFGHRELQLAYVFRKHSDVVLA